MRKLYNFDECYVEIISNYQISEYVAFALIYISINYAHAVLKCTSLSP